MGRLVSDRPARLRRTALETCGQRVVLPDHSLAQPFFHAHQLLGFAFEQTASRNAGPFADQLGDVFFIDFFLKHGRIFLHGSRIVLPPALRFALRRSHAPVTNFRDFGQFAAALVFLFFGFKLLDLFFQFANFADGLFFGLPARLAAV